jgi:uncharacterized SAM-binding protein YcdF (DUF218 family)
MKTGENSLQAFLFMARAIVLRTVRLLGMLAASLATGFFLFAHYVSVMPAGSLRPADGIVALTGDEDRISEAVRLLAEGKASRLLISGVNKATRTPQIINLNTAGRQYALLFRCCVDLDKRSLNTEDNASETKAWARKRGFRSIILVTSTYHIPRALIELRQSMPDVEFVPYPVKSPRLETEWWTDSRTTWVLFKEYLKFVTAGVRYAAHSLTGGPEEPASRIRTVNARMG